MKEKPTRSFASRHFTLIEVLVALGLIAGLLGSLMYVYRTTAITQGRVDQILWPVRQRLAVEERLNELFFEMPVESERGFCFYTDDDASLVFSHNNGVDREPQFSGTVLSRLYVDSAQQLVLATWPDPQTWELDRPPFRQEILLDRVDSLKLRFFEPKEMEDPAKDIEAQLPIETGHRQRVIPKGWNEKWMQTDPYYPALIELKIGYIPTNSGEREELTLIYNPRGIHKTPTYWHKVNHHT